MKFPRIYHLPWSPGMTEDDKRISTLDHLENSRIIVHEKLDGECSSMHPDKFHARSEESVARPWQTHAKALHAQIQHQMPGHIQIVGENVYAKHSIYYSDLTAFFYMFMAFDKFMGRVCSYGQTEVLAGQLGLRLPPVIYRGSWKDWKRQLPKKSCFGDEIEGYVVRVAAEFSLALFDTHVAKYVRKGHVKTDDHWTKHWVPNKLKAK